MYIKDLLARIEATAPPEGQAGWDNSGVQIAGRIQDVTKLAVALDPLPETIASALEWGAQCILTHHPLYMKPQPLNKINAFHEVAAAVLGQGAWLYAAHTSLDVQPSGPAGWLAAELGLQNTDLLETTHTKALQGVHFHAAEPREALVQALEESPEVLHLQDPGPEELFLVCAREDWPAVKALVAQHQENPAFSMLEMALPEDSRGYGLAGDLPAPMPLDDFCSQLAELTRSRFFRVMGPKPATVTRVAYCTGSGSSFMEAAHKAGAQIFITGDMKYHQALEAPLCVLDVGHFILEEEMMRRFAQNLTDELSSDGVELLFVSGKDPFDVMLFEQDMDILL